MSGRGLWPSTPQMHLPDRFWWFMSLKSVRRRDTSVADFPTETLMRMYGKRGKFCLSLSFSVSALLPSLGNYWVSLHYRQSPLSPPMCCIRSSVVCKTTGNLSILILIFPHPKLPGFPSCNVIPFLIYSQTHSHFYYTLNSHSHFTFFSHLIQK